MTPILPPGRRLLLAALLACAAPALAGTAPRYPRPFIFPLVGPSGRSVTRMGHPAAPDHGHHRALWWGHQKVGGVNFWEERGGAQQVRQDDWVHYQDGPEEAGIVVHLGWYDAH